MMTSSSGSVFGDTLQTITATKLEELAKQRNSFEEEYAVLLKSVKAEPDPLKRVCLLVEGAKSCLGVKVDTKKNNRVISGGTRNGRLETDLQNLDRFVEQARFDPSVSTKVLEDWEKTLLQYLSVQSTKFQYADLYGKLVTEWLSSEKGVPEDGDVEMSESFEEIPGVKKLASRADWEKNVFQPAEVDDQAVRSYLDKLFIADKKDAASAIHDLRSKMQEFENDLNRPTRFTTYTLRCTIKGLQNSDLLSNDKREALKDFLSNELILGEIADILNVRMSALDRWSWGDYVLLEQRRKLNGDFSIHFDPDLLQAIFLHYIGCQWSVFFKEAFLAFHDDSAWKSSHTDVPKTALRRRLYFLGDKGTKLSPSLEGKRIRTHRNRYFAYQLLDDDTQQVEIEEGEEEAEYGDYMPVKSAKQSRIVLASVQTTGGRTKQTARKSVGRASAYEEKEDSDDEADTEDEYEEYASQPKRPMEAKQRLLHLLSSEIIINTRLHGEFTSFRTQFDSWNPLLPHQTILTILDFLGVSSKWRKFFEKYLQAPLKFMDDTSAEPRLRRRGMPGSHTLSDMLGELVLFCLDFSVNQATNGAMLHRLGDDLWFWNKNYDTCANAWAEIVHFTEVMGVKLDDKKTGSVRISHDEDLNIDDRLPEGEIRWGFLQLNPKNGRFEIDQKMVDGHVEELRTQLDGKSNNVIDYIQAWNSYAATFFSSNFGKASNCFGREHVDKMLATHRHIQDSIFPGGGVVQHIKKMIEERFSVKDAPDGFLFWPVELGGLDLKSPFVGLLQIRESVKENPYGVLDEYEKKQRDNYAAAQRTFDKGDIRNMRYNTEDPNWKPEDADTFFSFKEFTSYPEEFASIGKAGLLDTYATLLKRPSEEPVGVSVQVEQALKQLSGQPNLRGITSNWNAMDAYWRWIVQMYGPEMVDTFGGINVVDFGLLPIGMVSMFRQRRTKWQG